MLNLGRNIIVPYCEFESLAKRFPKRVMIPDRHCPNDEAYYVNGRGRVRQIDLKDGTIWQNIHDEDGWPTLLKERVWPKRREAGKSTA